MTTRTVRLVVGIIGFLVVLFGAYQIGFVSFVTSGELSRVLTGYGSLAPLVFVILYAVVTVLFVPATPLTIVSGAVFGIWWGTVYVIIGATMGAVGAFLLARFVGGSLLTSGTSNVAKQLQRYEAQLVRNAFFTVFVLRLIPLFPFNGLNMALGLTRTKISTYTLATGIGIIPGTFAYVYFGAAITSFSWWQIGLASIVLVALTLAGQYGLHYFSKTYDK